MKEEGPVCALETSFYPGKRKQKKNANAITQKWKNQGLFIS